MAVRKKSEKKPVETKAEEIKSEPLIISNVTTQTGEVSASATPPASKETPLTVNPAPAATPTPTTNPPVETKTPETVILPTPQVTPVNLSPAANPLDDFKEKVDREMSMQNNSKKNYMWPILSIFIIAIILLAGVFAYKQGLFSGLFKKEKVNVVSLSPTPAASPVPTKVVDLKKYEIEILNGSEVDGEASRQKTGLETAGFTISSIGNADNTDYTDTIIKAKADVDKDFVAKLKTELEKTFTVGETQVLSGDSSVPIVVILGTKK